MNPLVQIVRGKVDELVSQAEALRTELTVIGWKDKRPKRTEASAPQDDSVERLFGPSIPAKVRIPNDFVHRHLQSATSSLIFCTMAA
jgi:hypothetical protein